MFGHNARHHIWWKSKCSIAEQRPHTSCKHSGGWFGLVFQSQDLVTLQSLTQSWIPLYINARVKHGLPWLIPHLNTKCETWRQDFNIVVHKMSRNLNELKQWGVSQNSNTTDKVMSTLLKATGQNFHTPLYSPAETLSCGSDPFRCFIQQHI